MRVRAALLLLLPAVLGTGCTCACGTAGHAAYGPVSLAAPWMIGVERIAGDVWPLLPYTNRLIADLAAMPGVQVVYVGPPSNAFDFEAWHGNKLRLATWLHGEGNCMTATYTVYRSGQQQNTYGLAVPPLAAGWESDPACIDRFATDFYQSLVRQGL